MWSETVVVTPAPYVGGDERLGPDNSAAGGRIAVVVFRQRRCRPTILSCASPPVVGPRKVARVVGTGHRVHVPAASRLKQPREPFMRRRAGYRPSERSGRLVRRAECGGVASAGVVRPRTVDSRPRPHWRPRSPRDGRGVDLRSTARITSGAYDFDVAIVAFRQAWAG
jgi:hypothetical protein